MKLRRIVFSTLLAVTGFVDYSAAQAGAKPTAVIGGELDRYATLENPNDLGMIGPRILVLDGHEPFLKLFDLSGKTLQKFVKRGAGPGEIGAARRFVFDSVTRRLYVWDVMNVRANVYKLGDTLSFETSYRTPTTINDGCFLGRRLFALTWFGGRLVHELVVRNGELQVLRSMGIARAGHVLDKNPNFQFQVAQGRIRCDEVRQQVVVVSSYAGVAQIIDVATEAQRTIKLDSLLPVEFWPQNVNGRTMLSQAGGRRGTDIVVRVEAAGGSTRLIADRLDPNHRTSEDFVSVTDWTLSATGILRKGTTSRQREVGRSGGSVVCFLSSPFPTIEIYRGLRCP